MRERTEVRLIGDDIQGHYVFGRDLKDACKLSPKYQYTQWFDIQRLRLGLKMGRDIALVKTRVPAEFETLNTDHKVTVAAARKILNGYLSREHTERAMPKLVHYVKKEEETSPPAPEKAAVFAEPAAETAQKVELKYAAEAVRPVYGRIQSDGPEEIEKRLIRICDDNCIYYKQGVKYLFPAEAVCKLLDEQNKKSIPR